MVAVATDSDVLTKVAAAETLPTPPAVLTQISKVVSDPNTSSRDVAAVVSEDPAMTARVLRMVNSAFYGLSDAVTSVRQAIFILGIDAIQSLVQCAGVIDAFSHSDEHGAFQEQFWRHSLMTASAARVLATGGKGGFRPSAGVLTCPEEAFTAGLLHDIGKMVLVCYLPEERSRVTSHPSFGAVPDCLAEREALGVDHANIGAELAKRWKLPASMQAAVGHHHDLDPDDGAALVPSRLAHAADYLAHLVQTQPHAKPVLPDVDWRQTATFGLDEGNAPEFAECVREEYGRAQIFLQMVNG